MTENFQSRQEVKLAAVTCQGDEPYGRCRLTGRRPPWGLLLLRVLLSGDRPPQATGDPGSIGLLPEAGAQIWL